MNINFDKDINGFQNARKLKLILEHYAQSDISDRATQLFIDALLVELNEFIANPEFQPFNHSDDIDSSFLDVANRNDGFLARLASIWQVIKGPSKRELLLSSQRQELIERAERAESIAFEAFAETADVGRQRDAALEELKDLKNTPPDQ